MEAEEVLDGGGRVEDVTFSRHHQHKAVESLKTKDETLLRFASIISSCALQQTRLTFYLKQEVSLREADTVDGGHLGGGGA